MHQHHHSPNHSAQQHRGRLGALPTQAEVEERYAGAQQLWSGNPNSTLVDFASTLEPGRAFDVGCGEGADVVWLATKGWEVTGIDLSPTAISRARNALHDAGATGRVMVADAIVFDAEPFDLVSVQYSQLPRTAEMVSRRDSWVRPGGHLLFVHHVVDHTAEHGKHGKHGKHNGDHSDQEIEIILPDWLEEHTTLEVVTSRRQERNVTSGSGAHHHEDQVLVLRKPA